MNSGLRERLPIRRQARGERRIEQILDAATRVFGQVGYKQATTNAIAAEAGISVGSLYQFFANKEQIADALEQRYADLLRKTQETAHKGKRGGSLAEQVGAILNAVVAFSCDTPGFNALFADRPYSATVAHVAHSHHDAVIAQLDAVVADHAPAMTADDRRLVTGVATQICRALMPSIVAAQGAKRERLVRELKTAINSYMAARTKA